MLEDLGGNLKVDKSISNAIDRFIMNIASLEETIGPVLLLLGRKYLDSEKEHQKFFKLNGKSTEINGEKATTFNISKLREHREILSKREKSLIAFDQIAKSFLISLISQYDIFLGSFIRALSTIKPESLNIGEKQLSVSQLQNFTSVAEAYEFMIDKEIDLMLRESHAKQFEWLEAKYNMNLRKDVHMWPQFIEATERRNLFVHTNGVVSLQYINTCKQNKFDLSDDIKLGQNLNVSSEYFTSAYKCIFEIGVGLAHVLWRKILPSDREKADENLHNICYNLLIDEKFALAKNMLEFATKDIKHYSSEEYDRFFIVNKALAYKWSGEEKQAIQIMNSRDWSATSGRFRLANAVILNDFSKADKIVKEIGPNGDKIGKDSYREWSLFREYRKSESFQKIFEEIFSEPLYTAKVEESDVEVSGIDEFIIKEIQKQEI